MKLAKLQEKLAKIEGASCHVHPWGFEVVVTHHDDAFEDELADDTMRKLETEYFFSEEGELKAWLNSKT